MNTQSLDKNMVLNKILDKCEENNLTFIGFSNAENEYVNVKTKLILKCNKCGHTWATTTYEKFLLRTSRCQNCCKSDKNERIRKIEEKCKELDFDFFGFDENNKLKLKCKKCGYEWNSTAYYNFLKSDRKSHTCGRKNPSSMPKIFKNRNEIKIKILKKLENTNLEFVDFVESEDVILRKLHVILRCKKCGFERKYSSSTVLYGKKTLECHECEFNNKIQNEEALKNIAEKCELLNYTFNGFDNEKNRYFNKETKLKLTCNICGYFWSTTTYDYFKHNFLTCKNCTNNWKMEKEIKNFLEEENIEYEQQKSFPWLKNKISMRLDFYLPAYNIAIECQGKQHFEPNERFGGQKCFDETKVRDELKLKLCNENNVKIVYFNDENNFEYFFGNKVIRNITDLKTVIYE